MKSKQVGLRLDAELYKTVKQEAEKERRSIAGMIYFHLKELYASRQEPLPPKE